MIGTICCVVNFVCIFTVLLVSDLIRLSSGFDPGKTIEVVLNVEVVLTVEVVLNVQRRST
jgi:hypothetical protein